MDKLLFLMGIGFAEFTMGFHMSTYIMDGGKFSLLAMFSKPFIHYLHLNNSIIPLVFT